MTDDEMEEEAPPSLDLTAPDGGATENAWVLIAHNKAILKGWEALCRNTPDEARRYAWLSAHAMRPIPRRCYPLKGKSHAGYWAYEIGSGNRVYYKPDEGQRRAVVYFAGPHPSTVPIPPKGL